MSLLQDSLIHHIFCADKTGITDIQFNQQVWSPSTFDRPLQNVHKWWLSQTRLQTLMTNCRCKMSRWDQAIYWKINFHRLCSQAESLKMKIHGKCTDKMGGSAFQRWQVCPWPTYGGCTHTFRWLHLTTQVLLGRLLYTLEVERDVSKRLTI